MNCEILISQYRKTIPIVAKIERPEAIANIDEIIDAADVIMVARGDMGVEISPEDVPILQKMIIKKCNLETQTCYNCNTNAGKYD